MDWGENYNEEIGLWASAGPGHSGPTKDLAEVHAGPNAASRLLAAAQVDSLSEIDVVHVLGALDTMIWDGDDGKRGCMRWYWEEDQPYDTNAAFFTGLSLIVLRKLFYDALDAESRAILDHILDRLNIWFQHAVEHATVHYPNKYLGDLVCGWLLLEILEKVEDDTLVAEHMHRAADYWLDEGWGWGEHLSDIYTGVCLNELSVLLLLADKLPDDLRARNTDLISALLSIEDDYDGGARVPALRSYAFQAPRSHTNFRDRVKPWEETPDSFGNSPDLGNLFYSLGWHDRMPPRRKADRNPVIPCFGGSIAKARIEEDIRIGSVTSFPVMPSAEHPTWGLSWQCFPVCFSRGETDWGFLQWEVMEEGVSRAHPANGGPMAHIPKSLTAATTAPVKGHTYAIQRGGSVLVLRVMPVIPTAWDTLVDRLRIIHATADPVARRDGSSQLMLKYPEREISVYHVALTEGEDPVLSENELGGYDWSIACEEPDLGSRRLSVNLWAFSIDAEAAEAPNIDDIEHGAVMARSAEERVRELSWVWSDTTWHVRIDPLAQAPLVEL